jgi:nucleolar GTP-binding protein
LIHPIISHPLSCFLSFSFFLHIWRLNFVSQVTDTPGLLARPDDFRNKMELLTLAALDHLPSSVMFVFDLTEECGTSVSDQWVIRQEVKGRYPDKLWVDVFSKADLLGEVLGGGDRQHHQPPLQPQPQQEELLSFEVGEVASVPGVQHEGEKAEEVGSSSGEGDSSSSSSSSSGKGDSSSSSSSMSLGAVSGEAGQGIAAESERRRALPVEAGTPAAVAAALPGAVKVSSVTEEGLDDLKLAIMNMLSKSRIC